MVPGTITASGGTLEVSGAVDATTASTINIAAGATLKFDSTVGTGTVTPAVTFQSSTGVLDLTSTTLANFKAHVAGFQPGDNIKVTGAASASLNGTANTLTVYNSSGTSIGIITLTAPTPATHSPPRAVTSWRRSASCRARGWQHRSAKSRSKR